MKKSISLMLCLILAVLSVGCNSDKTSHSLTMGELEKMQAGTKDETYSMEQTEDLKEWSIQEITSLFSEHAEPDWKLADGISVYDFAYERVGVILYTESDTEYVNIAYMDAEGVMHHCGIEAVLDENPEFTYHGNGEVTFNVRSEDGKKYTQKITFSRDRESVNFVSEAIE